MDPAEYDVEERMLAKYEPDDGLHEAPTNCVCCNVTLNGWAGGNAIAYCDLCNTDRCDHWRTT